MKKLVILFLILGILPLFAGMFLTSFAKEREERGDLARAYLFGLFAMLGIFQLLAVPMSYRKTSLKLLCVCFLGVMAVLAILGFIRGIWKGKLFAQQRAWIGRTAKALTPLLMVVCLCVLFQMFYVTKYQHIDEDDAYYLATATTAVENDGLYTVNPYNGKTLKTYGEARYILASWPVFIAMLAKASGLHATKLAHMVLPAVVLFWVYLVYFLLAGRLFPGRPDKAGRFLLFVALLHLFSGYSIYNAQVFALIRSWQGKAVLSGMGLPALFYACLSGTGNKRWDLRWSMVFAVAAGLTCFTTIASLFACVVIGCFGLYRTARERSLAYIANTAAACVFPLGLMALYYFLTRTGRG